MSNRATNATWPHVDARKHPDSARSTQRIVHGAHDDFRCERSRDGDASRDHDTACDKPRISNAREPNLPVRHRSKECVDAGSVSSEESSGRAIVRSYDPAERRSRARREPLRASRMFRHQRCASSLR